MFIFHFFKHLSEQTYHNQAVFMWPTVVLVWLGLKINRCTSMSSKNRPGSMAMMSSYSAAFRPGIDDRKESLIAHAPSTASSSPGLRHTELVLIQPLRNKVSPSTDEERGEKGYSLSTYSISCTEIACVPSCPGEWRYTSSARWGSTGAIERLTPSRISSRTVWHDLRPRESSGSQYSLREKIRVTFC